MNRITLYHLSLFANQSIISRLLLITGLLFISIPVFSQDTANEKYKSDFISWLTNNSHTIKTVDAGNGFEDLQPFKKILKDVQVVGLGEATHGTSEFFRMKHRMFEFLVKQMGYTNFLIESTSGNCRYINDYILYGRGNLDTATAKLLIPWRVEEVRNMIRWMRQYNTSVDNNKKVKFFGFDLQGSYRLWAELKSFYKKVNPAMSSEVDTLSQKMTEAIRHERDSASLQKVKIIFANDYPHCAEISTDLVLNSGRYKNIAGKEEYDRNLENIKLIMQELEHAKNGYTINIRDRYMAENILDEVQKAGPGEKFVVWAHNLHIIWFKFSFTSMGYYLQDALKDKYYSIGFEFYSGSFQTHNSDIKHDPKSRDWDVMSVGAPPEDSLPWYLNKVGKESFFIDFRNTDKDKKFIARGLYVHDLEGAYSAKNSPLIPGMPLELYNGLIYIKTSTAAKNFKLYLQ